MKVGIPIDAFVRIVDGETLFWNRRNTSCEIYEGVDVLASQLSVGWKSVETIFSSIASCLDVSRDVIVNDFMPIVEELISQGLIECDEDPQTNSHNVSTLSSPSFDEQGGLRDEDWTPVGRFFEKHRIPAELHIDLTAACTERCVHCYLPDYPVKHLPFDLVKKALREFREMQGLSVHLTGGECMLHPDFKEICMFCRDFNLNVLILSNMTLCNADMVAFLKSCPPQFVNVSLYSMKSEEHDAITTRPGSWRKTMDAILACEAAGVHIRLAAPLLKENQSAFADLKQFAFEHHMQLIPNSDIVPQCDHDCSNMDHACSPLELEKVVRNEKALFDKGWGADKNLADDLPICDVGVSRIYLNSLGNYYPCDSMHGYVLGNVTTDSLADVWAGNKFNKLRSIKNKDIPSCQKCPHRLYCKVCPAFNFNATGDLRRTIPSKCANAAVIHKVYGGE